MQVSRFSEIVRLSVPVLSLFLFPLPAFSSGNTERVPPVLCTYDMQVWNVKLRNSSQPQHVRHAYDEVSAAETDTATGCTVCSEDQEEISVPPLQPFRVCYRLAAGVRSLIADLIKSGSTISTIVGYHPIRSRGPLAGDGNRTELSNHSYGTAIDINPEENGLYDNCFSFGPQCRLLRGGEWHPGTQGTLTKDDVVVRSFKEAGFNWGGEIEGKQKDFMHFSPTGY